MQLVDRSDENDWSGQMQTGGQVGCNFTQALNRISQGLLIPSIESDQVMLSANDKSVY
jgi:hypothetical protein